MLKSLLSRFSPAKKPSHSHEEALLQAVEDHRKVDPLIGAKLGGTEVARRLVAALKDGRGVHVESLLCAAGAVAGYSCQASLRAQVATMRLPDTAAFVVAKAIDGRSYYFGDPLNRLLAESRYSIWSLAAGEAQHQGCKALPDLSAIFEHVTQTIGTDRFGVPRLPDAHQPALRPAAYLKGHWPDLQRVAEQFCKSPMEWPILFGCAAQEVLATCQGQIAPDIALTIVMESAVPMSKIELASA
jgi:hypothetical protein